MLDVVIDVRLVNDIHVITVVAIDVMLIVDILCYSFPIRNIRFQIQETGIQLLFF